ncbi:helix-turn-helix transcriptional regulator [Streptomyces sp. NPDC001848]|uniref:helix-turn-helix transcriptional regulator n=1 Tax=Streptomyces sp. NPDC001848 TaxID=3364618 RepID=UPI0036773791
MRAARLIKMVLLLQSRPSMTAAELAKELEVSERTVTRDAQALSEAGIPVYADRGRAGGYRLVGGYRTRLTGLARGEAEALFLSGVPGALREMGLQDVASAARLKVSAALLPSLRDAPRTAAQRFHLDAPDWFKEPGTPALLPAVADAVWDDRRITAGYRRGEDVVERALEPYGLVLKAGVWYLCARIGEPQGRAGAEGACGSPLLQRSRELGAARRPEGLSAVEPSAPGEAPRRRAAGGAGHGSFRVYRIDRFTVVDVGAERFARDEEFDLPAFWAERAEEFARSILRAEVVVRLSEEGVRRLPYAVGRASARQALRDAGAPDARGWVTAALPVESEEVAHTQLTALGPEVEVLSPEGLRARFVSDARRLAGLYGA